MKIATSLNIFCGHCPCEEGIARLAQVGFEAVDFNWLDLANEVDWFDERVADAYVDRFASAAATARLPWVQGHGPMFDMFSDSPENKQKRAKCAAAIRACGRLGVPWMVLHPDVFSGPFDKQHLARVRDANVEFFRTLLPLCEKWNVGLALENIMDSHARSRGCPRQLGGVPDELCELVDTINHPLVGACWDTGHARIMNLDQRNAIASLGKRLKAIHVQDNNGVDDDHLLPYTNGKKGVDWQAVADGLRLAGYSGAFTFEAHNSFRALPPALFDVTLRQSVAIARHIVAQIGVPTPPAAAL